jgi:hypothetical protein
MIPDRHILSRPHPVLWAGFRSDTQQLQQAGWEFSAKQMYERDEVGLVMRHGVLGIHAVTNTVPNIMYDMHPQAVQQFHVQYLTDRSIKYQSYTPPPWVQNCKPVDMRPQLVEVKSIEDMQLFAGCMARTNEVIVDPDDVTAMMDRILDLQKPGAQAHYEKVLRESRDGYGVVPGVGPRQAFHAQVVSLAG